MRRWMLTALAAALTVACGSEQGTTDALDVPAGATGAAGGAATREADFSGRPMMGKRGGEAEEALSIAPTAAPMPAPPMQDAAAPDAAPDQTLPSTGSAAGSPLASAMIIRTGNASLEVQSLDTGIARVRMLAQRLGGLVANTSLQGGREQLREARLELKIPAQRFDEAISGLSPIGRVEAVHVSAEDVSEEFVDISARVANARRLEERLIRLLESRAGKLEEVLAVERELARVREQIERYEGRIRYLRTRASISTLSVHLHEPRPLLSDGPGSNPIVEAFREAWRNFVGFVTVLIASLGVLVPIGVILALLWLAWRRWRSSIAPRARPDRGA